MAYDLGASSGRAMAAAFDGERLVLEEMHRFENNAVDLRGRLHWDAPLLHAHMVEGLRKMAAKGAVDAIGVDTWGVDYALLDRQGRLLGNPVSYRDNRTNDAMERAFETMPKGDIARRTGLAFLQFNTLYQLLSAMWEGDAQLDAAQTLMLMPDYLLYLLGGDIAAEYTHASTTQMTDPRSRGWSKEILEGFGIDSALLPAIQEPGARRGTLSQALAKEASLGAVPLVASASHDTAAAVAAVPAKGKNFAYISSGTWSLVGIESAKPVINAAQERANLTNEGGVFGTARVLKNVMGLWIIQECRRTWRAQGHSYSFAEICDLAETAEPFFAFIDPDKQQFLYPGDMPQKVCAYCRETGQRVPQTHAQIARVVYESLAMCYRAAIDAIREASGQAVDCLHIVGGGANNRLLNRMTADALGLPVYAGPDEATALGNALVQLYALGDVASQEEMRRIVAQSFPVETVEPKDTAAWEDAYGSMAWGN